MRLSCTTMTFLADVLLSAQSETHRSNGKPAIANDTEFFTHSALANQMQSLCDAVPWLVHCEDVPGSPSESSATSDIMASLQCIHDALVGMSCANVIANDPRARTCLAGAFPDILARTVPPVPIASQIEHLDTKEVRHKIQEAPLATGVVPSGSALERLLGHRISGDTVDASSAPTVSTALSLPEFTPEVAADALAVAANMQPRGTVKRSLPGAPARQSLAQLGPADTLLTGVESLMSEGWGAEGIDRMHDTLPVEVGGPSGFSGPLGAVSGFSSALPGFGWPNTGVSGTLPATPRGTVSVSGRLSRQSSVCCLSPFACEQAHKI
jgi:hypothetical protein